MAHAAFAEMFGPIRCKQPTAALRAAVFVAGCQAAALRGFDVQRHHYPPCTPALLHATVLRLCGITVTCLSRQRDISVNIAQICNRERGAALHKLRAAPSYRFAQKRTAALAGTFGSRRKLILIRRVPAV